MFKMKGILVVSFGTSFKETREKNITKIENEVKNLGYKTYSAFTSTMIIKKLTKQGETIFDVTQSLQQMKVDNITQVYILPTHLIYGFEYEKILNQVNLFKSQFDSIDIAPPLFSNNQTMLDIINILASEYKTQSNQALVLMGHGSEHFSNALYPALDYMAKQQNSPHIFVTTVEGYPDIDIVIKMLKKTSYTKVLLAPLMLVAGDHAVNDMASDEEDSLKTILTNVGFEVDTIVKGLGELEGIRQIYINHLKGILDAI